VVASLIFTELCPSNSSAGADPQGDSIWRCEVIRADELMRVGSPWWGQSPCKKRNQKACSLCHSLPHEDTARRHPSANQARASPGAELANTLMLVSKLRNMRNRCLKCSPWHSKLTWTLTTMYFTSD
jgi:hypothetical protein